MGIGELIDTYYREVLDDEDDEKSKQHEVQRHDVRDEDEALEDIREQQSNEKAGSGSEARSRVRQGLEERTIGHETALTALYGYSTTAKEGEGEDEEDEDQDSQDDDVDSDMMSSDGSLENDDLL